MEQNKLSDLLKYIVSEVDDKGGFTSTIRLVKFLYLIDIEYFRIKQRLLSELNWTFYKYGPYAFEIQPAAKRLGYNLKQEEFISEKGFRGTSFHVDSYQPPPEWLNSQSQNIINQILEIWCDQDTSVLLNYVYFQTEPMLHGKRNEPLDFSYIESGSRFYELSFKDVSNRKKDELLNSIRTSSSLEDESLTKTVNLKDESYYEFIKILNSEDRY